MLKSFIVFEDEKIKLLIPRQLRSKRGGYVYHFSGILKRGRKDARVILGIELDPPLRQGIRRTILTSPSHIAWMGSKSDIIRRGKCSFGDGGIEVLDASIVPEPTGTITLYRWNVLYRLGKHYLFIDLFSGGDLEAFQKMGTTIVKSIVVK